MNPLAVTEAACTLLLLKTTFKMCFTLTSRTVGISNPPLFYLFMSLFAWAAEYASADGHNEKHAF